MDIDGGSFGSPALPVRCREPDLVVYPLGLTGKSHGTPSIKTPPYQPSVWTERGPGESWGGAQTWQSGVLSDESLILELKGPDWRATNPHVLLKQHCGKWDRPKTETVVPGCLLPEPSGLESEPTPSHISVMGNPGVLSVLVHSTGCPKSVLVSVEEQG